MSLTEVKTIRDISSGDKMQSSAGDVEKSLFVEDNTRIVLLVEYNGSRYHGFQLQEKLPTIQGEIEKALKKLTGDNIRVITASRTDAGVHASGQIVSFRTKSLLPKEAFLGGLNYYLPHDIAIRAVYRTEDYFRVRSQAVSREYKYYILNSKTRSPLWDEYSYQVPGELDIEYMDQAAQKLIGEHDLASFASNLGVKLKNTRRRVYKSELDRDGGIITFNIIANSFLPHQVRNSVGLLIRLGLRRMTVKEFHSIMKAKEIGLAGPTAPARGLFLIRVNYKRKLEEYDIENI